MTTLREAAELAMEAMEFNHWAVSDQAPRDAVMAYVDAIHALRTALEQLDHPEQDLEMVARKPLTELAIKQLAAPLFMTHYWKLCIELARAIERAHGIGGEE